MLRVGDNHYQLVLANSGLAVALYPKGDTRFEREQVWWLEAQYVPAEAHYTPRADGQLEYLNLHIRAEDFAVPDWQKLTGLGLDVEDPLWWGVAVLENLLVSEENERSCAVTCDWMEVQYRGDYRFHCRFSGEIEQADGSCLEVELDDVLPFVQVEVYVPLNATDVVAKAREMAQRAIGFNGFAGSSVESYDPARASYLSLQINTHHLVTLLTPWRSP